MGGTKLIMSIKRVALFYYYFIIRTKQRFLKLFLSIRFFFTSAKSVQASLGKKMKLKPKLSDDKVLKKQQSCQKLQKSFPVDVNPFGQKHLKLLLHASLCSCRMLANLNAAG